MFSSIHNSSSSSTLLSPSASWSGDILLGMELLETEQAQKDKDARQVSEKYNLSWDTNATFMFT